MNLKPNKHKRISFDITTMASLGFIGPPLNLAPLQKKIYFFAQVPPQLFWSEIFRPPPKIRGGAATMGHLFQWLLLPIPRVESIKWTYVNFLKLSKFH